MVPTPAICDPTVNGELQFAESILPTCQVVFDVGARRDTYLVDLNSNCQFHLFEPMPASFEVLRSSTSGMSNVFVNREALGRAPGNAELYPDTESIYQRPHGLGDSIPIVVNTLDRYCSDNNIKNIDFLKIDVEGHELDVLLGGAATIKQATTVIQFEYGGTYRDAGIRLRDVFHWMGPGWYFYKIQPDGLQSVRKYRKRLEDHQYCNYVASRRELACHGFRGRLLDRLSRFTRRAA